MANVGAEPGRLKIFISYSRKDEDFAQDLLEGLEATGFEPYLDKHDIAAGEDWETRLGRLIETADTVVFVISPDAVASKRCAWEVDCTIDRKKRLLPIVWRRVEEAQIPPRLKRLNYIFFDRPLSFGASLRALATALKTDIVGSRVTRVLRQAEQTKTFPKQHLQALFISKCAEKIGAAVGWVEGVKAPGVILGGV